MIDLGPMNEKYIKRFWSYVNKTDGCWEWTGAIFQKGYGCFMTGARRNRKAWRAHRYSFMISFPKDFDSILDVLHSCDNRPCVKPEHLFQGTNLENQIDMYTKNRAPMRDEKGMFI